MTLQPLASTPAMAQDAVDDYEDISDAFDFHSAEIVHEMGELFAARNMHYPAATGALSGEMTSRVLARQPRSDPGEFLRFVAHNTNPHQLSFSWSNLLAALANCVRELSPSPLIQLVLSQNCVHCARAVEQTLQSAFDPQGAEPGGPELFQVDLGHEGHFHEICGTDQLKSKVVNTSKHADYLDALKDMVSTGQYACISVPVASVHGKFGHAMNIVNAGPGAQGEADRIFIVCGQSGKVFDLSNADDAAAFCARHANTTSEDASTIYFTPPKGGALAGPDAAVQPALDAGGKTWPPQGGRIS